MPRPTILVAEAEPTEALSVRKLVLETAKFNVLTAHSNKEAVQLFNMFPKVSAVVVVDGEGVDCNTVSTAIKKVRDDVPLIALSPHGMVTCDFVDHHASSYEPQELLDLLRELLGDPRHIDRATKIA